MKKSLILISIVILGFAVGATAEQTNVPADWLKGVKLPHSKDELHAMLDAAENDGAHGCGKWLWPARPEMVEEILGGQDDEARGDSARLQCAQLAYGVASEKKDAKAKAVMEGAIDPKLLQ